MTTEPNLQRGPRTGGRTAAHLLFALAALFTALAFHGLFLRHLFVVEDVNMEAMDLPIAVGHLEIARTKGVPAVEYFRTDPVFENVKREDPKQCFDYFGNRFQFEFFAFQSPWLGLLFVPFVKWVGVSAKTVALYSTFFAGIAWLGTGFLGWRMFGRWGGLFAMNFLASSLSWLIHVKVGYAAHTPCAAMMVGVAILLHAYAASGSKRLLVGAGVLLGLMYMVGWVAVVFATLFALFVIALQGPSRVSGALRDAAIVAGGSLAAIASVTLAWAWYCRSGARDIHGAIASVMFGRFSQGSVPGADLAWGGKLAYAFRCMFWDMTTFDHPDKYLEGYPAILFFFSFCFGVGLLYAVRDRTRADRILLAWLVSIFGVLGSFFLFTHRYALLAMPAMALVAARGVLGLAEDVGRRWGSRARWGIVLVAGGFIGLALLQTHRAYYREYILNKPANFEVDRCRGHAALAAWMQQTGTPFDTFVVFGDPILFPHTAVLFNMFGRDFPFAYWSNSFRTGSTPAQVRAWEAAQFGRYRRIVYVFSTTLLGDPQRDVFMNDWRPFAAAHPGLASAWQYSYAGRPPSAVAYVVNAPPLVEPRPARKPPRR